MVCEQERDQGEGRDGGSDSWRQTLSYVVSPPLDVHFNLKCPPSLTLGFFTVSMVHKFINPDKPGLLLLFHRAVTDYDVKGTLHLPSKQMWDYSLWGATPGNPGCSVACLITVASYRFYLVRGE